MPPLVQDAVNYLDAIKAQFRDNPEVYEQFLKIMGDFKKGTISAPTTVERVTTLFREYPHLVEGFNTFLP